MVFLSARIALTGRQPTFLSPVLKLCTNQKEAQQEYQDIRHRSGQKRAVHPPDLRQQESQRDQEAALPGQGDQQGLHRPADALEERSRGHVEAVKEKGQHIEPETVLRTVQIERVVRHEQACDLPGKYHEDQKPYRRDAQCNKGGHVKCLLDALVVLRAEIIAVDRLNSGRDAHKHGVGDLVDLHHHAVDRQRNIAAIDGGGSIGPHEVVQRDLHQGGEHLGEQTGKAQGQNAAGQRPSGTQCVPPDMDRFKVAQVAQAQAAGYHLPDHRGDPGPHHAHFQRENEDGVQDQVDDGSRHHALHHVLGRAVRPDDGGKRGTEQLEGDAPGDGTHIGQRFGVGSHRRAKEHHNLRGKDAADQGGQQAAGYNEGECMADGVVRLPLFLPPQAQADIGGAAVSQQQGHGVDQDGQRERNVGGRHTRDAHALADEDLVHDVVEIVDHQCQRGGDGVADDQLGDGFGFQWALLQLGFHNSSPSVLVWNSA